MGVLKVSLVAAASSASDEEATNKLLNPVVNEEAEGANSRRIGEWDLVGQQGKTDMEVDGFAEANQLLCSALEQLDNIIANVIVCYDALNAVELVAVGRL
uniref:Uncharacterized protein n=1 Tax=Ascaris lumbricoides TaxID=6252 RepID=A0A0M3HQH0_ASCLU